ncbi:MAG: GMC family oxidoreductase [Betaproteobacteria bacterium]|nr:GMC family oxidoreductase [Betaproteobacteria bacterium]
MTTKLKPVDVVVVGSGVVGSIMSMELANAGLKVLCLERGRMTEPQHDFVMPYVHDELKYDRHSDIFQDLSRETITFRNHMSETALPMRELGSFKPGEVVGGTAVHWGCNARRFLPHDFELRSRVTERYGKNFFPADCTSQDWGVTFDEVEPYYDQFEHIYGVGGKAGNLNGELQPGGNPHEGPRSREYPNPPTPRTPQGHVFAKAVAELGYTPFQGPAAAMTQDYTNLYKLMLGECARGGFCSSYACSDARGRQVEQPAGLVVLATYCFNNTRLLLLSGIGSPYDPAAGRGVVGRNYAYQTGGRVQVFFDDREFNPFIGGGMVNTSIDDLNGDIIDRSNLGFVGGAYIGCAQPGAAPIKAKPVPHGTPRWGGAWKKAVAENYRRALTVGIHGSCQSYRQHYLDLDPTYKDSNGLPLLRMTFDWHRNEQKMLAFMVERCVEIANAMKPAKYHAHPIPDTYSIVPYQSTHNMGGAVMGADPATSVVNKYLQSWDVPNLFVVGGSAFPQNPAQGPTETIGMLACWAADGIKDIYLKRPGPMV